MYRKRFQIYSPKIKRNSNQKKVFGPKTETTDNDVTIEEDRAANSYAFVGNLKRPFDTIQWLCSKTQSSKESFGFYF